MKRIAVIRIIGRVVVLFLCISWSQLRCEYFDPSLCTELLVLSSTVRNACVTAIMTVRSVAVIGAGAAGNVFSSFRLRIVHVFNNTQVRCSYSRGFAVREVLRPHHGVRAQGITRRDLVLHSDEIYVRAILLNIVRQDLRCRPWRRKRNSARKATT